LQPAVFSPAPRPQPGPRPGNFTPAWAGSGPVTPQSDPSHPKWIGRLSTDFMRSKLWVPAFCPNPNLHSLPSLLSHQTAAERRGSDGRCLVRVPLPEQVRLLPLLLSPFPSHSPLSPLALQQSTRDGRSWRSREAVVAPPEQVR
jgi:hypothetical protein